MKGMHSTFFLLGHVKGKLIKKVLVYTKMRLHEYKSGGKKKDRVDATIQLIQTRCSYYTNFV